MVQLNVSVGTRPRGEGIRTKTASETRYTRDERRSGIRFPSLIMVPVTTEEKQLHQLLREYSFCFSHKHEQVLHTKYL